MPDACGIGVVVSPGFRMLAAAGPAGVFGAAASLYDIHVLSDRGGVVTSAEGFRLDSAAFAAAETRCTTLVLADLDGLDLSDETRESLRCWPHRLAAVGNSVDVLERLGPVSAQDAAGGIDAGTGWWRRGTVWNAASVSAGVTLALELIGEDHGRRAQDDVAASLGLANRREPADGAVGRQSRRIGAVLAFIADHLEHDLSVEQLASVACLSERQFLRVFATETGMQPTRLIQRMRVEAARTLIEDSTEAIGTIAERVGFGDLERLRRACLRHFDRTPQELRRLARGRDGA